MLGLTRDEIEVRARTFVERLRATVNSDVEIDVIDGQSVVGGGSAPGETRDTALISIRSVNVSPTEIEGLLRAAETPVIGRIENDRVLIDLRTVAENEEELLAEIVGSVIESISRSATQTHS
jgi:L-seryl-tRNA(Ser) seleniumtransferase